MCRSYFDNYERSLAAAGVLFGLAIAATVAAIALNANPWTSVFGGAAVGVGIAAALFGAGVVTALTFAWENLRQWYQCMTSVSGPVCHALYILALTALSAIIAATLAIAVQTAHAAVPAFIPGLAIPLLTVAIVGGSVQVTALGVFGGLMVALTNCIRSHSPTGSIYEPVVLRPGGGSPGTGAGSGPPPPPIRALNQPTEIFGAMTQGEWFRRWPSGTVIDGGLGPDVCPICLYTLVVDGEMTAVHADPTGRLIGISVNGGEVITIDGTGKLQAVPVAYMSPAHRADALLAGRHTQGVVTDNGMIRAVLAGQQPFDFKPYVSRG